MMKEKQKMKISQLLKIEPGLCALIGGGGKTTLMYKLAEELSQLGSVIVCTSTRIYPPEHLPVVTSGARSEILSALCDHRVICVGTTADGGKLAHPAISFDALKATADYVIVEADGAHRLPIKAHAAYEPVIPACTDKTVLVIGADAFNQPIFRICHRPERFIALADVSMDAALTPELAARVIALEGLGDAVYFNKVETEESLTLCKRAAERIGMPVIAGSLRTEEYICLH